MKTFRFLVASILLRAVWAQDVPPPPKPTDEGPSLEGTLKYIEQKLGSMGSVSFMVYYQNSSTGNEWTLKINDEIANVRTNAKDCRIDYYRRTMQDGRTLRDQNFHLILRDVKKITVTPGEQDFKEGDAKAGRPEWNARLDPAIFVVEARQGGEGARIFWNIYDEDDANRLAKAIVHAVELCGGGNKDPF